MQQNYTDFRLLSLFQWHIVIVPIDGYSTFPLAILCRSLGRDRDNRTLCPPNSSIRPFIHSLKHNLAELILLHSSECVGDRGVAAAPFGSAGLRHHEDADDCLRLMHTSFECVDVALGWTTLPTRAKEGARNAEHDAVLAAFVWSAGAWHGSLAFAFRLSALVACCKK
jgi:hypothetical protein